MALKFSNSVLGYSKKIYIWLMYCILGEAEFIYEENRFLKAAVLTRGYHEVIKVSTTNLFFRKNSGGI
jgi:hypothetical protein